MTPLASAPAPRNAGRMVNVRIKHVTLYRGRPAFMPGPSLKALGFTWRWLRHANGQDYTLDEMMLFSHQVDAQARAARAKSAHAEARPRTRLRGASKAEGVLSPNTPTLGHLLAEWLRLDPRMLGRTVSEGKKSIPPLAPATIRFYTQCVRVVERLGAAEGEASPHWALPLDDADAHALWAIVDATWQERGLKTAHSVRAMLQAALGWAVRAGRAAHNPALTFKAAGHALPGMAPRVNPVMPADVAHLVATADALGRADVGDLIWAGALLAARPEDRRAARLVQFGVIAEGFWSFEQGKKRGQPGAMLHVPVTGLMAARLDAAKARRASWRVQPLHVFVDERAQRPWKADWFRHVFAEIRDAAAETRPALAGFRDQDLRDTALDWLNQANVTPNERASFSGHADRNASRMERHYVSASLKLARAAAAKRDAWLNEELAAAHPERNAHGTSHHH